MDYNELLSKYSKKDEIDQPENMSVDPALVKEEPIVESPVIPEVNQEKKSNSWISDFLTPDRVPFEHDQRNVKINPMIDNINKDVLPLPNEKKPIEIPFASAEDATAAKIQLKTPEQKKISDQLVKVEDKINKAKESSVQSGRSPASESSKSSSKLSPLEKLLQEYTDLKNKEIALIKEQGNGDPNRQFQNDLLKFSERMFDIGKPRNEKGEVIGATNFGRYEETDTEKAKRTADLLAAQAATAGAEDRFKLGQALSQEQLARDKLNSWTPIGDGSMSMNTKTGVTKPTGFVSSKTQEMSVGQKELDKKTADEVSNWNKEKGSFEKALKVLKEAKDSLIKQPPSTGYFSGKAAKIGMQTEYGTALKQKVHNAVMAGMKAVLPGSISNEDREFFMSNAYDEGLDPKYNIEKIDRAIIDLENRGARSEQLAKAFKKGGGSISNYETPALKDMSSINNSPKDVDPRIKQYAHDHFGDNYQQAEEFLTNRKK